MIKEYGSNENVCFLKNISDLPNLFTPFLRNLKNDLNSDMNNMPTYIDLIDLKERNDIFLKFPMLLNQYVKNNKQIFVLNKKCKHKISLYEYICLDKHEEVICPTKDTTCIRIFDPKLEYTDNRVYHIFI